MNIRYLIIVIATCLLCSCTKRDCFCEAQDALKQFYNYSTVDWDRIDSLYYRPYNCDWPDEVERLFSEEFPSELIPMYWHMTQNAKTYLHQQILPLRIGAPRAFIEQLNRTEAALDSVFVHTVSQAFYMRNFVDCYQQIMPQQIDSCFEAMTR